MKKQIEVIYNQHMIIEGIPELQFKLRITYYQSLVPQEDTAPIKSILTGLGVTLQDDSRLLIEEKHWTGGTSFLCMKSYQIFEVDPDNNRLHPQALNHKMIIRSNLVQHNQREATPQGNIPKEFIVVDRMGRSKSSCIGQILPEGMTENDIHQAIVDALIPRGN